MNADSPAAALRTIVGDEHVVTNAGGLRRAGITIPRSDYANYLVSPSGPTEVAEIVSLANRNRLHIVPLGRAARSAKLNIGVGRPRVLLSTNRLCHIVGLDETSLVVHVQAGMTARELDNVLGRRNLTLGDYPPSILNSSVGGLLAARTPGKTSPRHGFIEDAVIALSAVLADGRVVRTQAVPRRASGPELARALCGSEGSLGIITSVVLRVYKRPQAAFLAAYQLPDFSSALAAVRLALRDEAAPSAIRVYDAAEARTQLGASTAAHQQSVLVVCTAGPTDLAACDRDLVASAVTSMGGQPLPQQVAKIWWDTRTGDATTMIPPTLQVTAAPSKQLTVYTAIATAAQARGWHMSAHASRFGDDGAVLFITVTDKQGAPLVGAANEAAREHLEKIASEAGALALNARPPAMSQYLRGMRTALDPNGIMASSYDV